MEAGSSWEGASLHIHQEAAGRWRTKRVEAAGVLPEGHQDAVPSALQRRVEAAPAVHSFGAGRLRSLLTELLSPQSAAEP